MIATTQSGSVYEIDIEKKQIRRLSGQADPTPRQGKDGEWKEYAVLLGRVEVGAPIIITWEIEDQIFRTTITSKVVSVQE